MTKQKSTKKTLLTSVLSLVLCMAMLIGTTFAWFTDSVSSTNNIIKSGNLDVELWHCPNNQAQWGHGYDAAKGTEIKGDTALFLNADGKPILWEPGAGAGETFRVKNAGSLALKFKLNLKTINATKTPEGKDLTDILNLQIIELQTLENGAPALADDGVYYEGLFGEGYVIEGELLPGETADFNVAIDWFPSANDNDYNVAGGLEITFAIDLLATQLTYEKDSWDDQYDKNADYDGEISTADALNAALINGGTYKVLNNITVSGNKSMEVPAGVEVVLDMGDKAIGGSNAKNSGAVLVNNGSLTIINGTVSNRTVDGDYAISNKGTLVLDGVTVNGAPISATNYPNYAVSNSGKLIIEKGTAINSDRGTLNLSGSGETVINGGTFTNSDLGTRGFTGHVVLVQGQQKLTMNGGTFKTLHATTSGGTVINNWTTGAVYVNGGSFSGGNYGNESNLCTYGYGGTYVVTGGTYTHLKNAFLADGYTSIKNADGTISVVKGVKVDDTAAFTNAINDGETEIYLADGNYDMPETNLQGKTLTINGTKDTIVDVSKVDARNQFVTGATIVFDGVTLDFGKANYMGFANTASLTYRNCNINGLQFLFGKKVVFENCVLNSNGAEHCVWTYGAQNVSFTGCDFVYGDRGINCYSDNDVPGGKQNVNFTDCTFKTENTTSKGAVEINSCFFSVGIEVNLEGCTAPAYGKMAYVSEWDSNNGEKTTINIK